MFAGLKGFRQRPIERRAIIKCYSTGLTRSFPSDSTSRSDCKSCNDIRSGRWRGYDEGSIFVGVPNGIVRFGYSVCTGVPATTIHDIARNQPGAVAHAPTAATAKPDFVMTAHRRLKGLQPVIAVMTVSPAVQTKLNIRDLRCR